MCINQIKNDTKISASLIVKLINKLAVFLIFIYMNQFYNMYLILLLKLK